MSIVARNKKNKFLIRENDSQQCNGGQDEVRVTFRQVMSVYHQNKYVVLTLPKARWTKYCNLVVLKLKGGGA